MAIAGYATLGFIVMMAGAAIAGIAVSEADSPTNDGGAMELLGQIVAVVGVLLMLVAAVAKGVDLGNRASADR
jgi:hypothetical protein